MAEYGRKTREEVGPLQVVNLWRGGDIAEKAALGSGMGGEQGGKHESTVILVDKGGGPNEGVSYQIESAALNKGSSEAFKGGE